MTSFNHVEGSSPPAKIIANPNKDFPNSSQTFLTPPEKWNKSSLLSLQAQCVELTPIEGEFNKLVNPLVEGLKKFSPTNEVYCPKCGKYSKLIKHGKTNDSYQFICHNGEKPHQVSALQIIATIPDEFMLDLADFLNQPYRTELLNWAGRQHLCPEIWETKGMKNASKRYATELSPIKMGDTKIRAVNSSLEAELNELKLTMKSFVARLTGLELENQNLKSKLKSTIEENSMLRRFFAEKSTENEDECEDENDETETLKKELQVAKEENAVLRKYFHEKKSGNTASKETFAAVADIHKPAKPIKKPFNMTPIEVISKGFMPKQTAAEAADEPVKKFEFSPLKMIFFEGCQRRAPIVYRQMFREIGVDNKSVRDITFLTEEIVQIMTYESAIPSITEALEKIAPSVRRIVDFDPCKGENYAKYGNFTDEVAKASYFAMMTKSAERITKMSEGMKSMKRSAAFMNKIVELTTTNYAPNIRKPRCFVLRDFIEAPAKLSKPLDMEIVTEEGKPAEPKESTQVEEAQDMEVTIVDINDGPSH